MQGATITASTRSTFPPAGRLEPRPNPQPGIGGLGTVHIVASEQRIYAEGEPARHFYEVQSGAIRVSMLLRNGHRQIVTFAFPGEIFGLETGAMHRFGADALASSTVIAHRTSCLSGEGAGSRPLPGRFETAMIQSLGRVQDHVILLGRRSAVERIASFLCRMSDRLGTTTFDLPMSRSDIADHLGLTIESVSRTLTSLANAKIIAAPCGKRTISVLDMGRLLNRCA